MLPPDPKFVPHKASDTTPEHAATHAGMPAEAFAPLPPMQPAALSAAPSLTTLLHAFRRAWRFIVPMALLGAVGAAAVAWLLIPPQYTSSVVFRILTRPQTGSGEDEGLFVHVQRAQVAILKGYDVLNAAIDKSRVAELYGVNYTPMKLSKRMVTAFNEGPEILNVQLSGENPEAIAALLNAMGETYPQKVNSVEEARVKSRIAQLRKKLVLDPGDKDTGRVPNLAELLRDKRIEVAKAEENAGLDDAAGVAEKYRRIQDNLQTARQQLSKLKQDVTGYTVELEAKERRIDRPPTPIVSDAEVVDTLKLDPEYMELMKKVNLQRQKIEQIRATAAESVKGRMLRTPLADLRDLEDERRALIDDGRRHLASKRKAQATQLLREEVIKVRDLIELAKKQEPAIQAEMVKLNKEMETYRLGGPKAPPEVEALRDQMKQLETEQKKVGDELAGLEGSLPLPPRVTKHTDVYVPTEKEYARPMKYALAASVLGFGFVAVGLCLLEARGRRVYASEDVMQGLGMRVVGTLPMLPAAARKKAAQTQAMSGLDSQYGMTEAIDAIRTVLLHAPRVDGARVVMVTSAMGGEGKTTLASHLAASLARAWRKTLLIDGDLRHPVQHVQFDQSLDPGLCEALRGEAEFDDVVKPTTTSRLWMMPAGKLDTHALQALAQEGVTGVFEHLKEQYDFIVIDSSPILPVPDALLLGKQADVVLLAVMKDHSRLPAVYQAQQRLENLDIRVLGTVVIGEKTETYGRPVPYPQSGS